MRQSKQLKVIAGLDGFSGIIRQCDFHKIGRAWRDDMDCPVPDYLDPTEGHGYIQRIIDGFTRKEIIEYHDRLIRVISSQNDGNYILKAETHQATCEQKIETILRCGNLWEEE